MALGADLTFSSSAVVEITAPHIFTAYWFNTNPRFGCLIEAYITVVIHFASETVRMWGAVIYPLLQTIKTYVNMHAESISTATNFNDVPVKYVKRAISSGSERHGLTYVTLFF